MPKILAFAGSTRHESFNKRLIRIAASESEFFGATTTVIDLHDFPLPLYDGDLEQNHGIPNHALQIKRLMKENDGFLIACPEYNSSITAVLKNTIDWCSRPGKDETALECFHGKVVGLLSASPGGLGGMRGLVHARSILHNLGCYVVPEQVSISQAHEAFDHSGHLKEPQLTKVKKFCDHSVNLMTKLKIK